MSIEPYVYPPMDQEEREYRLEEHRANLNKLEKKLEALLEHQPIDEEAARNLTRQIAAAQYAAIPDEEYETLRLRRFFSQVEPMETLDAALLKNTVSHIRLTYGGIAGIQLKNGQLIERRSTL